MCGTGDMLAAVRDLLGSRPAIIGVDIDPICVQKSKARFSQDPALQLVVGNSFAASTWEHLGWPRFDLVITNPPYVRYQTLSNAEVAELPTGREVRASLSKVARALRGLPDPDRRLLLQLIERYSGLSDLAVPAWILCAMLVAPGGTLAMVVPETWLTRAYALPIRYLLVKLFRVRVVVEDASRTWFPGALVKTNLVVADRIDYVDDPLNRWRGAIYPVASVPSSKGHASVVSTLYPASSNPERDFAGDIRKLQSDPANDDIPFNFQMRSLENEAFNTLLHAQRAMGGLSGIGLKPPSGGVGSYGIPEALRDLITLANPQLTSLERLGALVGQGLRTGANPFFYADILDEGPPASLRAHKSLGGRTFLAPREVILPALRSQAELPASRLSVQSTELKGRLLNLDGYALTEDFQQPDTSLFDPLSRGRDLKPLPPDLADHVRHAATVALSGRQIIPEMSAVRTNASKKAGRFWYCLPPLRQRHTPDILVPRVNFLSPCSWLNSGRRSVVDANFSTVWLSPRASINPLALLAIFNSEWIRTSMELTGAVMGAGALKLEAIHVRTLPFPIVGPDQMQTLTALGARLCDGDLLAIRSVDSLVSQILAGPEAVQFEERLGNLRLRTLGKRTKVTEAEPDTTPPSTRKPSFRDQMDMAIQPRLPHFSEARGEFS